MLHCPKKFRKPYSMKSGHPLTLGLTQPLTGMSTSNISWGDKGGQCLGLTTLRLSCADCFEIWEPQPLRTLRICPGLYGNFCTCTMQ